MRMLARPLRKYGWFCLGGMASIILIMSINLWMVTCGHCSVSDFLAVPWVGWLLIIANVLAFVTLFCIKRLPSNKHDINCCIACSSILQGEWLYCPVCGLKKVAKHELVAGQ
ncbi:MAG: hypothetical protein JRE63_08900 [Deltaproteobacteria bacterium]|nr:hypothetical protein [Deltaproteobacteria bacterium]MBW2519153.1 hypothetical protein [Deltaproteobacteria bacterium]